MKKLSILLTLPLLLALTACGGQDLTEDPTDTSTTETGEIAGDSGEAMEADHKELPKELETLLDAGDEGLGEAMEAVELMEGL